MRHSKIGPTLQVNKLPSAVTAHGPPRNKGSLYLKGVRIAASGFKLAEDAHVLVEIVRDRSTAAVQKSDQHTDRYAGRATSH